MKLLVLTMHDELVFAERALRAGAVGYVNKQEVSRSIVRAIREILRGKMYLSQRATERMVQLAVGSKSHLGKSPVERLTDREIEVFQMIGEGTYNASDCRQAGAEPQDRRCASRTDQAAARTQKRHRINEARRTMGSGKSLVA